jgi:hypothetical protein
MTGRYDHLRDCNEKSNRVIAAGQEFFYCLFGSASDFMDGHQRKPGREAVMARPGTRRNTITAQRLYIAFQSAADTPPLDWDVLLDAPP